MTFSDLKRKLRATPIKLALEVARRASPELTSRAQADFSSGRTAYGDTRPEGKHGPLSLVRTGAVQAALRFATTGTITRAVLGPRYARYLVGKYRVLPMGRIPRAWAQALERITHDAQVTA